MSILYKWNKNKKRNIYKGFSMVEAVIAITILLIIITPAFTFVFNLLNISRNITDKTEMTNLAYQGTELLFNLRENIRRACKESVGQDFGAESYDKCTTNGWEIFKNILGESNCLSKNEMVGLLSNNTPCQIDINNISIEKIQKIILFDYNQSNNDVDNILLATTSESGRLRFPVTTETSNSAIDYNNNIQRLFRHNNASIDYNPNNGSSTQYARMIWYNDDEGDNIYGSAFSIKIYSLVCIIPPPNTKSSENPCNPWATINKNKRVIISNTIYW